jgi:hypothetical protein
MFPVGLALGKPTQTRNDAAIMKCECDAYDVGEVDGGRDEHIAFAVWKEVEGHSLLICTHPSIYTIH